MANPNCKILIYDTSDALTHTITTDIISCVVKTALTSNIGTFNFVLPTQKGFSYVYNDIGDFYKAEIYMGYGTLGSADLQLTGRILKITNKIDGKEGIRVFEGKDLGEQLERQFIKNVSWNDTAGYLVAGEIASVLAILNSPTKTAPETQLASLNIRTESYFDVLKKLSDYWIDSSHKIQKDFYVDAVNDLYWKDRPLRTSGVETLTYGGNILGYTLTYDIMAVKNSITVYGAPTAYLPDDKDSWTESLTDWSAASGTLYADATYGSATPQAGSNVIRCNFADTSGPPYDQDVTFTRVLPRITLRDINKLNFYYFPGTSAPGYAHMYVRLLAPDTSNYFQHDLSGSTMNWHWEEYALGDTAVYDATENPSAPWVPTGSPNWWNITGITFHGDSTGSSGTLIFCVDKLYFSPDRWVGFAEDVAISQANYGLREAEYTDANLLTDTDCTKRAESLLMQLKEKTIAVELNLNGNTNVKIGDRIPLTLPPDNISSIDFDVINVEHSFTGNELKTNAQAVYSADIRSFPPTNPAEALNKNIQHLKTVTSEIYERVVR
jgi:hypothetical protein